LIQELGPAVSPPRSDEAPANFSEVLAEALAFPVSNPDKEQAKQRVQEHVQRYFEETWIHRPLSSLSRIPPVDAAGHANLRKKLLGAIQFLEECAVVSPMYEYDFNRLRRKLGLLAESPASRSDTAAAKDYSTLSTSELAALSVEALADESLEQAYQAALHLDARELAGRFARAIVSRPPRSDRPDRFPWFAQLAQFALDEGNTQAALDCVNEGEKTDCEHNEGRRRNDYELRRGQIHAKRGETDAAQDVFERLIARVPAELRYRGNAAEAMLAAKQGSAALLFAEQGLAKAREKNDRDSEGYFLELVAAAQKQK
jgi:hypothetical protein